MYEFEENPNLKKRLENLDITEKEARDLMRLLGKLGNIYATNSKVASISTQSQDLYERLRKYLEK